MPDTPAVVTTGTEVRAPRPWTDYLQDGLDAALHALARQRQGARGTAGAGATDRDHDPAGVTIPVSR